MANLISILRLLLLLPVMGLLAWNDTQLGRQAAFVCFVIAAGTDLVDGWVARRFNCVTAIGTFLDPLIDKILANVLLVFLAWQRPEWISPWLVLLILAREFAVQGFRSMAPCKGVLLQTRMISKWKFVLQAICIGMVLAGGGWPAFAPTLRIAARVTLIATTVIAYLSMIVLFKANRDLWKREPVPMEKR